MILFTIPRVSNTLGVKEGNHLGMGTEVWRNIIGPLLEEFNIMESKEKINILGGT